MQGYKQMGQHEIIEFLQKHQGKFYTLKQLSLFLRCSYISVCRASNSVVKREGFEFRYNYVKRQSINNKTQRVLRKTLGYIQND